MMRLALASLAACLVTSIAAAHPYHDSQTEIDYREPCRCLEIAIRLKPEDLEAALIRASGKRLPIEDERVQEDLQRYVRERFVIATAEEQPIIVDWVGMQVDVLGAWVFLQSEPVQLPLRLSDRLLLEHESQQINRVIFRANGARQVLNFSVATPSWQTLEAPVTQQ